MRGQIFEADKRINFFGCFHTEEFPREQSS
ncbi:MAG: hypothetical protein K0S74_1678 [Chlamydiales bacterium]|jgi:hypothetical protein|nr:hypothetical protein [Chlamydiales bacterium]